MKNCCGEELSCDVFVQRYFEFSRLTRKTLKPNKKANDNERRPEPGDVAEVTREILK